MNHEATCLDAMPTSYIVVDALNKYFSQEEIDLRDITDIAMQDPIMLANILFLVNETTVERGSPLVNTLSAAINLVGLEPLKKRLLSINAIRPEHDSFYQYELIRNRIYIAASLTQFWAKYMGQTTSEEMYCASMLTGLSDLSCCLHDQSSIKFSNIDLESIESIQTLYKSDQNELALMPDSIQCLFQQQYVPERLKLSVLTYELVACLELGYSTEELNKYLLEICDYVGIGIHRAGYDLTRHMVEIERSANYHAFNHSQNFLATNMQVLDPIQ